jgi:signal transduction histidine kinase/sugar-specific transcriptional regulator TrmB
MESGGLTDILQDAGLSPYQAEAYVRLLELGTASATELAEASDVPDARIYDVLRDLDEHGYVEVYEQDTFRARAVDPDVVVEDLTERAGRFEAAAEEIRERWQQPAMDSHAVSIVKRFDTVFDRAAALIGEAENEVQLAVTPAQFEQLRPALGRAFDRLTEIAAGDEGDGSSRSAISVPLSARDRIVGVLTLVHPEEGVLTEEDLALLRVIADQAGIAVENARLFTQTDQALARRVDELSLFQRIDQQLNKSLDLNRVLSLALDWAIALTDADGGSIGLLVEPEEDGAERVLRLLVYKGLEENGGPKSVSIDHPILAQILAEGNSVVTYDVTEEQSIDGTPATMQLAVPVKRDGIMTGLITLESQQVSALDEEDIAFVERLADRAAVAIKNARLYEDIHAANKAKSDFISVVTHELRLPLTSIRGYTDLISSGMTGPLTDQQEQFLLVIRRNLDRMGTLIRDLSDINRIESGRMKFECEKFDVREIVADVADSLREAIEAKQQTLTIEVDDEVPAVYADPTRISQVLTNLLSNANKYTPDEGVITLRVSRDDAFAQVSVIDTGIGISEENQAKLFTQFFRAEDKEVREQAGWGLGLSIVKKMVEAQGGEIGFESKLGQGSTFAFTVPLADVEAS